MLGLSSLSSRLHHALESIFLGRASIKVDRFDMNHDESTILVLYRIGRQKLTLKASLINFSTKYFDNLSGYDRQRITKFITLQDLLCNLFSEESSSRKNLIVHIKVAIKNDKLF